MTSLKKLQACIKRIQKNEEHFKSLFYRSIMAILVLPIPIFIFWGLGYSIIEGIARHGQEQWLQQFFNKDIGNFIGIALIAFTIIFLICYGFYNDIWMIFILKKLQKFNISYAKIDSKIENFDEIISGIEDTYSILNRIRRLRKYAYTKDSQYLFLQKTQTIYCIEILKNLKSDLISNISKQQQILESAKSEVEKNIQGNTELEQVSELQKIRLDKQIEQFEELQRVLVKV